MKLKGIDQNFLAEILSKNRPKIIDNRVENGVEVKVYEARDAANYFSAVAMTGSYKYE